MVERRRLRGGTRPGVTPCTRRRVEPGAAGEQLELARGEAGGPEVELALRRRRGHAPSRRSCSTPVAGSKSSPVLEEAHREAAEKALSARRPPGRSVRGDPAEHRRSRRGRRAARSRPGRGRSAASNSPSDGRGRARRAPRRSAGRPSAAAASRASRTKSGAVVDADHLDAAPRQRERVTPRPAPDVEHPHPRLEPERARRGSRPPAPSPW